MNNHGLEEFKKLNLADGQVIKFSSLESQFCVDCLDWQGETITLIFDGSVGLELFDIVGEDLSHAEITLDDPFIERSSRIARDNIEGLMCFSLWSAWSNEPIMRIVARSVTVIRAMME